MTPTTKKSCLTCRWVEHFRPRDDEKAAGHVLGCRKPGWEGYTSVERMACGGVFFRRAPATPVNQTPVPDQATG